MRKSKILVAAAISLVVMAALGIAFAEWTATSSNGKAYAKAKTAVNLSTNAETATATLYPGKTGGDAKITVANDNDYKIRLTTINGNGTITSDKGVACDASTGVTFTNQTLPDTTASDVAAHSTLTLTLTGSTAMDNTSDNTCQGAVFTIPVAVSGHSQV
jgi:hypothetical protein